MLPTSALHYDLPPDLIAARPAEPRDASRLMVVRRDNSSRVEHRLFRDLPEYLRSGDRLVFNTSCVLPARFAGERVATKGGVEGLYLCDRAPGVWEVMLRSGGRLMPGDLVRLRRKDHCLSDVALRLEKKTDDTWHACVIGFPHESPPPGGTAAILSQCGITPLPPYIRATRKHAHISIPDADDQRWYQTVYADHAAPGSVAAPTAGLHFTEALLDRIASGGISRSDLTLHVGPGTFKPVQTEFVEQHPMHPEWISLSAGAVAAVNETRAAGGRIIPVGTTSVRALESLPVSHAGAYSGETRLLIAPGFAFRWTDALITNFHLPNSTLLALVAALFPGGVADLLHHYATAIDHRYRFYSYGDAMLIL